MQTSHPARGLRSPGCNASDSLAGVSPRPSSTDRMTEPNAPQLLRPGFTLTALVHVLLVACAIRAQYRSIIVGCATPLVDGKLR